MVMVVVMPMVMVMMGVRHDTGRCDTKRDGASRNGSAPNSDINTNNANAGPEPSDLARRLVSEISKVSHRNHCRSDPVRVQST